MAPSEAFKIVIGDDHDEEQGRKKAFSDSACLGMLTIRDMEAEPASPDSVEEDEAIREVLGEEPRNIMLAMINQLTKGMDLHRISFPTFVLEPRSMLERITDFMSHPDLILQ